MSFASMCGSCPHSNNRNTNFLYSLPSLGFFYFEDWAQVTSPWKRTDCGEYLIIEDREQLCFDFMENYI